MGIIEATKYGKSSVHQHVCLPFGKLLPALGLHFVDESAEYVLGGLDSSPLKCGKSCYKADRLGDQ